MDHGCREFLNSMAALAHDTEAAASAVYDDWRPDQPPVTVLFGALGVAILGLRSTIEQDRYARIMQLIESAMQSNDVKLVTAVATGLIEDMLAAARKKKHARASVKRLWSVTRLHVGALPATGR